MSPLETVNAFIAAIEAKDVNAAVAFAAENISYENMPTDPIVGHAGLAKTLQGFLLLPPRSNGGSWINGPSGTR